ncbi:pentatricopeptide repeat-containing protein At2g03380, mitochondrial [Punica granatum]|uniref:Uncharacterized protein n=2 Tax=Punica granatum TaxID=22663 RepID=A0A218XXF2_PUNGR|nr:pentatricopeptide repeat-containing protein At2g03380, mitochondrial [Punica granatum]OWM89500.1 hypothetical protein CDL15_Pgr024248 [Punica granatum]PKI53317.1 hypothetical protein CRG98_026254 [Punica granatum]
MVGTVTRRQNSENSEMTSKCKHMKLLFSLIRRRQFFTNKRSLRRYCNSAPRAFTSHQQRSRGTFPAEDDRPGILPSAKPTSSRSCYSLLGYCNDVDSLKKVHCLLIVNGLTGNLLLDTKLVSLYGSIGGGHVSSARKVFDRMPSSDLYSWKVMLRLYFLEERYSEVIGFYKLMRARGTGHDNVVLSIALKACSEMCDVDEGRKVHCHILKESSPDSFVFNGLVDMYAKCGEIESSRDVFDKVPERNVVLWTSMIAGYVQNDHAEEGLVLFNRMREELIEGNEFTLGSLMSGCTKLGALHQGKWVHGYLIKKGVGLNSFLATSLLDLYMKCGKVRDARNVFDELPSVDLVAWTAMIVGYAQNGFSDMALKLFRDKRWTSLSPNSVTIASCLSACAQLGDLKIGKSVHGLGIKLGIDGPEVKNALLGMYAKCRIMEDACLIFESLSDKDDIVSWNSMISGLLQNGSPDKALELFHHLRLDESTTPDSVTLVIVLSASASLGAFQVGSSIHAYGIKEGLLSNNVYVETALLNFYAKCGDTKSARMIFDGINFKNTITWSAMIGGYGIQGSGPESLALFGDMLKEEVEPSEVIFTTILSACRHTGMVEEGLRYFRRMCEDYKFVPSMKHYASMVDLLSRAGRLEDALEFMEQMPVEPDVGLFGAFLHGCGLYSRFDLGERAIEKMLKLHHPDEACYYVLMSNLYASDGRWTQANQIRKLMERWGLRKFPGCSAVEIDAWSCSSLPRAATVV